MDDSQKNSQSMSNTSSEFDLERRDATLIYTIPGPSIEQRAALEDFRAGRNILIDSVAGGGKTTFVLHIALSSVNKKILFLTYNKRLRDETSERSYLLNIANMKTYTYHGFCLRYFGEKCHNNLHITQLIKRIDTKNNIIDVARTIDYDAIIIDEAQDMLPLYYRLVKRIVYACSCANNRAPQICIIGDQYQTIYEFMGADSRFLTMFDTIICNNNAGNSHDVAQFTHHTFHTSFRCTREIANFVNALLGYFTGSPDIARIQSNTNGPPVSYVIANIFHSEQLPNLIMRLVDRYGINNIFIVVPSVTARPYACLIHELSRRGIDIFRPDSDEREIKDDSNTKNKLSIVTYHQSKGLERDCAIALQFDSEYFKYYARNEPSNKLHNAQYVAVTRAKKELIVVQHYENNRLAFVNQDALSCCNVIELNREHINLQPDQSRPISVTNLIRFVSSEAIALVKQKLHIRTLRNPGSLIKIPSFTTGRNGCAEDVQSISGIAIPVAYACELGLAVPDYRNYLDRDRPEIRRGINEILDKPQFSNVREHTNRDLRIPQNAVKYAAIMDAAISSYTHKLQQITGWSWINLSMLQRAMKRMRAEIGPHGRCEYPVSIQYREHDIRGSIDWFVQKDGVDIYYELKCTTELRDEHILQLAIYAFIVRDQTKLQEFRLFNIRTNELKIISASVDELREICDIILNDRVYEVRDDNTFIEYARKLN